MTGINKTTQNTTKILRENIINDFLPHVGKNYRRKALYLGYMIRKMIRIYLGYDNYDNRDSYMNKRIDSPGILLSNLFRQCYGKMSKEIKGLIERELNLWRANYNNTTTDIINDNNIHRYFKQSLLDSLLLRVPPNMPPQYVSAIKYPRLIQCFLYSQPILEFGSCSAL